MSTRSLGAFLLIPLLFVGGAACGGSAFETTSSAGSAGTSASGGNGSGATSGTNGIAGSKGVAGTTSTGGTTSIGGSGSGGGAQGGSGGVDMSACTQNSDCELEPVSCCSCGIGPVSDFTAINSAYHDRYEQRCDAADCAGCPPVAYNPNNPAFYYVPTCQAGRCTVVDLKTTPITACQTVTDCMTRQGTGCCASCGGTAVTINAQEESALESLVCSGDFACGPCASPGIPAGTLACESGRCVFSTGACTATNPCPL